MDIKIKDKDISLTPSGIPETVSGFEQAVQQIGFALTIPRGSFVYNREIGLFSDFDFTESDAPKRIEALVNESLIHSAFYVGVDYISINSKGTVIGLIIDNGYEDFAAEVVIDGQL